MLGKPPVRPPSLTRPVAPGSLAEGEPLESRGVHRQGNRGRAVGGQGTELERGQGGGTAQWPAVRRSYMEIGTRTYSNEFNSYQVISFNKKNNPIGKKPENSSKEIENKTISIFHSYFGQEGEKTRPPREPGGPPGRAACLKIMASMESTPRVAKGVRREPNGGEWRRSGGLNFGEGCGWTVGRRVRG